MTGVDVDVVVVVIVVVVVVVPVSVSKILSKAVQFLPPSSRLILCLVFT